MCWGIRKVGIGELGGCADKYAHRHFPLAVLRGQAAGCHRAILDAGRVANVICGCESESVGLTSHNVIAHSRPFASGRETFPRLAIRAHLQLARTQAAAWYLP